MITETYQPIIEVKQLTKIYNLYDRPQDRFIETFSRKKLHRDRYVLKDISFDVRRGESVGIILFHSRYHSLYLRC